MAFLNGITLLLLYQLLGEITAKFLQVPIPGPVIGMVFLFVTLLLRSSFLEKVESTSNDLLKHLSLLYVPAGVGVMVHANRVADQWLPIVMTLVFSTLISLAAVALIVKLTLGKK